MTPEQMQDFFNKVKGKKIKLNWWEEGCFIPTSLNVTDRTIFGDDYGNNRCNKGVTYNIEDGFGSGFHDWAFYELNKASDKVEIKIEIERKCICSSSDLFNFGCKCGGK